MTDATSTAHATSLPRWAILGLTALLGTACPSKIEAGPSEGEAQAGSAREVTEDDPRVVRDTDDLYAKEDAPTQPPPQPSLGTGRPDETNGVCRLYAPKLPDPQCCPAELGFDAERFKELCGLPIYLGESMHHTCGYHFMPEPDGDGRLPNPLAVRVSKIIDPDTKTAAEEHDERIQVRLKQEGFTSEPIPGIPDAYWSSLEGLHWAFIPGEGWGAPRLVTWRDGVCSDEAMQTVLAEMTSAKPPPPNAPRPSLVPQARK